MSFTEDEFTVAEKAVKAERRFRRFKYLIVLLSFGIFCFVALELFHIRNDNRRFVEEVRKLTAHAIDQNRIQNEETRRYNTCLLLTPIEKRTPEKQRACFESGNVPGGLESDDFTPVTRDDDVGVVAQSNAVPSRPNDEKENVAMSSEQNTPIAEPAQQEKPQPPKEETPAPEPPPSFLERTGQAIRNVLEVIL